mgnify:CR=1 FL=1
MLVMDGYDGLHAIVRDDLQIFQIDRVIAGYTIGHHLQADKHLGKEHRVQLPRGTAGIGVLLVLRLTARSYSTSTSGLGNDGSSLSGNVSGADMNDSVKSAIASAGRVPSTVHSVPTCCQRMELTDRSR